MYILYGFINAIIKFTEDVSVLQYYFILSYFVITSSLLVITLQRDGESCVLRSSQTVPKHLNKSLVSNEIV